MDPVEIIRVALESLAANKLRSGLTMLGIVIGVGAVIALMSIGTGAQASVTARILSLGSNLITVTPGTVSQGGVSQGAGSAPTLTLDDANAIASSDNVQDVVAVSPELFLPFNFPVVYHGQNVISKINAVTPAYEQVRNFHAAQGAWFTDADMTARNPVVMLGNNVAQELFGNTDPVNQQISIRAGQSHRSLRVLGVLESKGGGPLANVDDQILIPLTTLQRLFYRPRSPQARDNVSRIVISASSLKVMPQVQQQISGLLLARHKVVAPDFVIQNQQDQISAQTGVTQVLTILLGAIAGISLIVGGIGVMNIMIVSVTERTREIGIRKAVGAKKRDILMQFLVEAVVVSILGGAIGILMGVGASNLINGQNLNGQAMQTVVTVSSILLAAGVSLCIGVLFGVYPAYRAAGLRPIDALRYE